MQLKLSFDLPKPLSLPLGHHSILQGFIYSILSTSPEYEVFLHETGFPDGAHHFKLFVFSTLRGHHTIRDSRIIYEKRIYLDIRSPHKDFCNTIMRGLQESSSLELAHQPITLAECTFMNHTISTDTVNIRMLSPITLSTTYYENEKKKTRFICPDDDDFANALTHNTISKYRAAFKTEPPSSIELSPIDCTAKHKYVTRFDDHIYINAWNGTFRLYADPAVITFLYDAGIGSRNSQGFGMFDII